MILPFFSRFKKFNLKVGENVNHDFTFFFQVQEMLTPSESELVFEVLKIQDRLLESEIGLDDTIFILQMFLYYQTVRA